MVSSLIAARNCEKALIDILKLTPIGCILLYIDNCAVTLSKVIQDAARRCGYCPLYISTGRGTSFTSIHFFTFHLCCSRKVEQPRDCSKFDKLSLFQMNALGHVYPVNLSCGEVPVLEMVEDKKAVFRGWINPMRIIFADFQYSS